MAFRPSFPLWREIPRGEEANETTTGRLGRDVELEGREGREILSSELEDVISLFFFYML